jgi:hypothetical protein
VLAVPREASGVAMAATRALIRRGVRDLHLIALPTSGHPEDAIPDKVANALDSLETRYLFPQQTLWPTMVAGARYSRWKHPFDEHLPFAA